MEEVEYSKYRWWAFLIMLLSTLLISLNTYMVQVALPIIEVDITASFGEAQLIFSGYALGLSAMLIAGARLGDIYGRRKILLIGVAIFMVVSLGASLTTSPYVLIFLRTIQGLAAALIQPQVLTTIQYIFPEKEKPLAFAMYGAAIGLAFAFGLILGGLLVDSNILNLGWRLIFLFNLPFCLLIIACAKIIPETKNTQPQKMDWTGAILLIISLLLLIYPLTYISSNGYTIWAVISIVVALALLLYFVKYVMRINEPLIDLRIFKNRTFSRGIYIVALTYSSMFAYFFLLSYFLQSVLYYSIKTTSLIFLPLGIGFFITSIFFPKLFYYFKENVLRIGLVIMVASLVGKMLYIYYVDTNFLSVTMLSLLFIYGLGLGLATTPLANILVTTVDVALSGTASGIFTTCMYLVNVIAVLIIGSIFAFAITRLAPITAYLICIIVIILFTLAAMPRIKKE